MLQRPAPGVDPALTSTGESDRPPGSARLIDRVPGAWWSSGWDARVVAALVVAAAILRVPNLGRAYWVDEGISIGIASGPLTQIPHLLRLDGSPPLFYAVLHLWLRVFGASPVSTHVLALLISLAVIPVAFWAGRTLFGREAAYAAAGLAATSPFLTWYGTETRMYTMLVGLCLVSLTFTVRAVRYRIRRDAFGAVVASAAIIYTHNWGLYVIAVTASVVLIRAWRSADRGLARGVIVCGLGVGLLYSPWSPTLIAQIGSTAAPWAVPPGVVDLLADPATMLGGTLGVVILPALIYGVWSTRGERPLVDRDATGILGAIGLGTLAMGWVVSSVEPSWTVRYLGVTLAALLLGLAGCLASSSRGRAMLIGVCVVCTLWGLIGSLLPNSNARYAKSNVAAVAAAARADLQPGDLVVVSQTEQLAVLRYYLPPGLTYLTPTGVVTDPKVVDWRHIVSRLQAANPCQTILPAVSALPTGARILEISPLRPIGSSGSAWSRAVNAQVVSIGHLLADQTALMPLAEYRQGTSPKPFSGVVGELYAKSSGSALCQ
ncbi:MAG: glycosyltransferase family 39 protein [Actinomycetota bacterium]|nr:glycosyltransferase family 39 protein [Actinomycetota bacterium]